MRLQIASDVESPINRKEPHVKTIRWAALAAVLVALLATGCTHRPGEPLTRSGDEIIVAGQLFHTGTRVITFLDPEGYNAYRAYRHFNNAETMPSNPVDKGNPNRYSPTRRNLDPALQETVDKDGWTLENLRKQVDQFVIHYDVCGTAQQCFYILHDYRGLSVHFMLDLDGTVYQTLDLRERAWHGNHANDRSVGIEIAHPGAYGKPEEIQKWYRLDGPWPVLDLERIGHREMYSGDYVPQPTRKELIEGDIQGRHLYQYDYTEAQYKALIKLTAGINAALPKMALTVPGGEKSVIPKVLSKDELAAFSGLIAHWHIVPEKVDPGPAFDWARVLEGARRQRGLAGALGL